MLKTRRTDRSKATQKVFDVASENWGEYYGEGTETLSHIDLQARLDVATAMLSTECSRKKQHISILDVGCGTGDGTSKIQQTNVSCFAMDFSKKMVSEAVRRYPYLRSSVGDAVKIPYRTQSFDIVLSLGTLEYIAEYRKAILEIHRVLKSGGYLVFSVPNASSFLRRFNTIERSATLPLRRIKARLKGLTDEGAGLVHAYHHMWWSLSEMRQLLKETGFALLDYRLVTYGWLLPTAEAWAINRRFCRWMNTHCNGKGVIARNFACTAVFCARVM